MSVEESTPALPRRDLLLILVCVGFITVLAWAYLVHLSRQMSSSMEYDAAMAQMGMIMPVSASGVLYIFAMWSVMMVGMMSGSAVPVLLLFTQARRARAGRRGLSEAWLFGAGYLAVWTGFSAVATAGQVALQQHALLSPAMAASSPLLGGAILIAAGAYQLMPLKRACLTQCRSPLGFLMTNWRDGAIGALQMGMRHGIYCLGCCWALMLILFTVGIMNLIWVAVLAIFVLIEKTGTMGTIMSRIAGIGMASAGIVLIVRYL